MGDITKIPVEFKHRRLITAGEMYAQPDSPPDLVWEICTYIRGIAHDFRCMHCPTWEDYQGKRVQRGCYGLAHEAVRIVGAYRARFPESA